MIFPLKVHAVLNMSVLFLVSIASPAQSHENQNFGVISGVVLDERGIPLPGAEVDADELESAAARALRLALTDDSGRFTFNPIKFGTYKFYALKPESGYPDTKFELYAENYHRVSATVSSASPTAFVTIIVGPMAGVLKLEVLDEVTRQAIPNPTMILRRPDTGVWVSVNRSGDSKVLVPPGIPTQLTVRAAGYTSWSNYDPKIHVSAGLIKIESGAEAQMTVALLGAR